MNQVGSLAIISKCETFSTTVLYCVKVAECGSDGCCRRIERREEESEIKKNESEKEIGSNGEMETKEEIESCIVDEEKDMCWEEREK